MIKKLISIFISLFIIISLFITSVSAAEPIEYFLGDGSMSSNCIYYNSAGDVVFRQTSSTGGYFKYDKPLNIDGFTFDGYFKYTDRRYTSEQIGTATSARIGFSSSLSSGIAYLESDYLSVSFAIRYGNSMSFSNAKLVLSSSSNGAIEIGSKFCTEKQFTNSQGVKMKILVFYFSVQDISKYLNGVQYQPITSGSTIDKISGFIQYSTTLQDTTMMSSIKIATNSSQEVINAINDGVERITGKLDDVTTILSQATEQSAEKVKQSIESQTDAIINTDLGTVDKTYTKNDVDSLYNQYESAENALNDIKNYQYSVDLSELYKQLDLNSFNVVNGLINRLTSFNFVYIVISFSLTIGLITYFLGRRVR